MSGAAGAQGAAARTQAAAVRTQAAAVRTQAAAAGAQGAAVRTQAAAVRTQGAAVRTQAAAVTAATGAATARTRPLAAPRAVAVEVGPDRRPVAVGARRVEAVREDWVVEDRWWTADPLRRRYFELVLADGRNAVVFHDLEAERGAPAWFAQRG